MRSALGRTLRVEYRTGANRPMMLLSLFNVDAAMAGPKQQKVLEKVLSKLPELVQKLDLTPDELDSLRRLLEGPAPRNTPAPDAASRRS